MQFEEFESVVAAAVEKHKRWFQSLETPAMIHDIEQVELRIGAVLPIEFRRFALRFGGGYFGMINISSLKKVSSWYILDRPQIIVNEKSLLVVSDDETGGYYGFKHANGQCDESVTYVAVDDGCDSKTVANSFCEFILRFALPESI